MKNGKSSPMPEPRATKVDADYLADIIEKAMKYADSDPETSLMYARKSAEGICTHVFAREIGSPGNARLDKLIELLSNKDCFPERVKIPLRVIQQYGNYAAHIQPDHDSIDRPYIEPCLTALVHVSNWFFLDYLHIGIPSKIVIANNNFEPSPQKEQTEDQIMAANELLVKEMALPFPLRPYQLEGITFLVRSHASLLADEMGLGKTVQSIIALRLILHKSVSKRVLIIAPASLVRNWERELHTWAPSLSCRRIMGSAKDRRATYRLPIQVLITTYEQVRLDALEMDASVHFEIIIVDEGQRIKNRHSRSALACRLLSRTRSWVLTGTPLENNVEDLVSIFLFLNSGLVDVGMSPIEIHSRIQKHFLRRRKKDVLAELPPIIIQDVPVELSGYQEATYTDLWVSRRERIRGQGNSVTEMMMFALITKLKQLCNYDPDSGESVKLDALLLFLEDMTETDDKVILFSQYVQTLMFISQHMGTFPHDIYTGEQSPGERDVILARFRSLPGPRALLMSLQAGGVGLNIQEASTVILFDRWWNPAVENQAIQRAHRFGRTRPLHVIRFLVSDTIEERIEAILQHKQLDFDRYIEKATNAPVSLFTRDELRKILDLSPIVIDEQLGNNNLIMEDTK